MYKLGMNFVTIILAAGQGKRMRSKLPKPLHRLVASRFWDGRLMPP